MWSVLFHKYKALRRKNGLENVLFFWFITKSLGVYNIIISPDSDFFVCMLLQPSFISVLFVHLTYL